MSFDPNAPDPAAPDLPLASEDPAPVDPPTNPVDPGGSEMGAAPSNPAGSPFEAGTLPPLDATPVDAPPADAPPVDPPTGTAPFGAPAVDPAPDTSPSDFPVVNPDAPADPAPVDAPLFGDPLKVATPDVQPVSPNEQSQAPDAVLPADDPALANQATDPATGEPLTSASGAAILPLGEDVPLADHVDPAATQPDVPVIAASVDPSGAAQQVLDHANEPDPTPVVPTRAEMSAQAVLDSGTLTPPQPGAAMHPVETLDGHTVDPTGTADDGQPGGAFNEATVTDADPHSFDTRVNPADRNKGVTANLPTELSEEMVTSQIKALAELGVHKDLAHQWVDQAYSDLQGQRSSAQSAGDPDPYPNLVF